MQLHKCPKEFCPRLYNVRQIEMRSYYPKRSMVVLAFLSVKSYCVGLIKYRSVESLKKDKSVTKQD